MPSAPSPVIAVTREEDPSVPGQSGWVLGQTYASLASARSARPASNELLRAVGALLLRSTDGGRSWTQQAVLGESSTTEAGRIRQTGLAAFYLDPDNGLLVQFLGEVLLKSGSSEIAWGSAVGYGPHTGRIFYRISRDGGLTWEPPQQLIESGSRYSSEHWARDVWYGRSALVIEGQTPYKLRDGTIAIPAYLWPTDDYMQRVLDEQNWPEGLRNSAPYFVESRCLLARWKPDLSGLTWHSGGPIRVAGGWTGGGTLGSDEPAVAYLDARRWFAVVRTGTAQPADFKAKNIPMLRQCSRTEDGGRTWRLSEPLRFDDGATVYSPCAWSAFAHSRRTGKWYWIGNILSEPTWGDCDPRYPLQIVELDPWALRLRKSTLTIIEDRRPEDDRWVRFSNFRVYEERGSGDLILLMQKSYCEFAPSGLPTPSYRYRINLPAR